MRRRNVTRREGGPIDTERGVSLVPQSAELDDGMAQLVLMDIHGHGLYGG
ncbi:MAG TPA: hypothetical protein VGQ76_04540 [Thermoanaerobaculia bacterium]|nr:hypothetical protein [Thermoanaerobaculia bacterium]